jgi:hypothetical protein
MAPQMARDGDPSPFSETLKRNRANRFRSMRKEAESKSSFACDSLRRLGLYRSLNLSQVATRNLRNSADIGASIGRKNAFFQEPKAPRSTRVRSPRREREPMKKTA